jgi:PAS domain S-box-containing protein
MSFMLDTIHVLHVDDEPGLAEMATTFLQREDEQFSVETATSVSEGLDRLSDGDIDCIVSDYDMPGQNGIEFLKAVRKEHPELPFILFTGKGSEEVASDAISTGVTDYLQKESGTDQYMVLANRIRNSVEKYYAESLVDRAYQAMDRSREGIALLDADGEFMYVNEAYIDIVGYNEDELIGEFWERVYPDEQVERVYEDILPTIPEQGHWTGDTVYQRKDGSRILVNHALAYSEEGTMMCLLRDLTDVEAQRQALHQEQQRFDLFVDAVEDYAILMLDPEGHIVSWNRGAERIKGYTEDEILGKHFSVLYPEELRQAGLPDELLEQAQENGSVEQEGPRLRKDGSTFQATSVITAVYDEDGTHRGFGKVTKDITARKRQEREQEQIIERVTDAIVEVDADWQFTLVNEQAEALYDMSEEKLLERDFWDVFEAAKGTRFEEEYRQVMETRNPTSFVEYFSQLDGWFDIEAYPKQDGGIAFYFTDVTEQRQREQELEEEQQFVQSIFDALPDPLYAFDTDGYPIRWNDEFEDVTGYTGDEIAGMDVTEFVPEDETEKIATNFQEILETKESVAVESAFETSDGDRIPYEFTGGPLIDADDTLRGVTGIGRDLTARKEQERRLTALNETSQELMAAKTLEEVAEIGVEAAATILGLELNAINLYNDEQAALVPIAVTDAVHELIGDPPNFTGGDSIAWRAYEQGEPLIIDDTHEEPDIYNPETPVKSELHLPLDEYGLLMAGSETSEAFDQHDLAFGQILAGSITAALKQVERTEQLRAREQELAQQNGQLEQFTSVVSHDLRNPLNVAEGRLELAKEECDSEHLDHVRRAHERMTVLIADLLTLAREGDAVGEFESVDLGTLVENCWQAVGTADVTLAIEVERTIWADSSRLQQLLENLMRNAVEHGDEDVTVTVGSLDDGFYVEDDGPGISEDEQDEVFEAGYSTTEEGTGFGLSIVKQVADAHGWEVGVTDGSDGGARFEITGVEFAA